MHVAGVNADPATFEHIDPAAVGNAREVLDQRAAAARAPCSSAPRRPASSSTRPPPRAWSSGSRQLEHDGYQFEAADGSFDLLIRRETGEYEPLFRLESWRVIAEKREDGRVQTEATIKIWVDGERYVRTAEGNGPVNALDAALRAAIARPTRTCAEIGSSTTRCASSTSRGRPARSRACCSTRPTARTPGARSACSENVIEASWDALVDSLEAGMLPGRVHHSRAAAARTP